MKIRTTLLSGAAAAAVLSLTASLGAVAAPAAEPAPVAAAAAPGAVVPASTGTAPMPLGVPGPWSQTFSDDFNGTTLDAGKGRAPGSAAAR